MVKVLIAGCVLSLAISGAALAVPMLPPVLGTSPVVRVAGGCAPAFHRNAIGYCVPNGYFGPVIRRLPPPCPRFYHRDPDPARPLCYPNF